MRRTLQTTALAAALLTAAAAAQTSSAPALLTQAVAATAAAKVDYAFDVELAAGERNWSARFDPNASPRLRLVSPERDTLDDDERRAFDRMAEQMDGVSWCASDRMNQAANLRLVSETAETATYAFQPTREMIRGEQARRYADRLRGEFTLVKDEPDIARFRIFLPQGFSPMPLVSVERFNVVVTCAEAPNGRHYAAETVSEVRGSAFGSAFDERSVQRARNLSAAP
jgi:hypothetical protein